MSDKYIKINTLWKRNMENGENKGKIIEGEYSRHEFKNILFWRVSEKIHGCLHYTQKILTDEGYINIGKIVNNKLPVKVASYNKILNVVELKDIEHYHKEKIDKPLISVSVKSRLRGNRTKYIVCTDNHKFFTNNEWIQAKDLKKGTKIYHIADLITEDIKQLILGGLIGDSSIYRPSEKTRGFSLVHSITQSDYFQFKADLFGNLFHENKRSKGGYPGSKETRCGNSIITPAISEFIISMCEINGKKVITEKWVNAMNPLAFAILYMDDGSCTFTNKQRPRAVINVNGLSLNEAKLISNNLNKRFNIKCNVFVDNGPRIKLSADGTETFFNIIYPYVPKIMKYKLSKRYKNTPCSLIPSVNQYLGLLKTEVISVSNKIPARAKGFAEYQYDLNIKDNSNYFTNGILVHNTNTRIMYHIDPVSGEGIVSFGGKTDDAQMSVKLFEYLQKTFTIEKMEKALMFKDELPQKAVLYCEGYGPKIQKGGGRYRDDESVILFDALIDGWWLDQDNVTDIAQKLKMDRVPELGIMTEKEIVFLVKNQQHFGKPEGNFISKIAKDKTYVAEGIVARSYPLMLFRNGTPIMFKLKVCDFK